MATRARGWRGTHLRPNGDRPGDSQDGGLQDDGWFYQGVDSHGDPIYLPSYQPPYAPGTSPAYARFLTQEVLEVVAAGGIGVSWRLRLGDGALELSARYLLEAVWNENTYSAAAGGSVPTAGKDSVRHYLGLMATYSR